MQTEWPLSRDLVLIGGGHTHALVLRSWGMAPLPGARVTLINPDPIATYTGMLPGHVAGHYARDDLDIDLVRLARFAGARIVFDKACGLDRRAGLVLVEGRTPIRYDIASIDVGVTADLPDISGFSENAHSVKPLGPFADAWSEFLARAAAGKTRAKCVVIGAGVGGIELALAMAHRLREDGIANASVTVLESGRVPLSSAGTGTRRALLAALSEYGIAVLTDVETSKIESQAVHLADGRILETDFTVSAAGAKPYPWMAESGLQLTNGFIDVGPDLRTITDPAIFAVGDCANLTHAPRPKAGVFAVREAPILLENLKAALSGKKLREFHPQSDFLKLVSLGRKSALAQKYGLTLSGPRLWWLKDKIDRKFMSQLCDLPAMTQPSKPVVSALNEDATEHLEILCGGCGSKVGRGSLAAALSTLAGPARPDIMSGSGDDAAVLKIGGRRQVISTDHLRAFTEDPYLLARIAAVHALGDIWAMGATPQAALLSLVIPRMSEAMQVATVTELVAAVSGVLNNAGADLVGGHTSMGRELMVGLTVTGLLEGPAVGVSGAKPGDALILTKPIGTGVILAAEMRGRASGCDVEHAFVSMQRPLAVSAGILAPHAHAMTDVTGFGLAGHLMTILEGSRASARIALDSLPLLPGAEALAAAGIRSSIWASNARLGTRVVRPASAASDLIYDPQTAGGLLAAVPHESAARLLTALEAAGEPGFLIGEIEDGEPQIRVS